MSRLSEWLAGTGRGIRGAPMTPSKSWSSVFLPKTEGGRVDLSG